MPLAACARRVDDHLRGRRPAAGPGSDPEDDEPAWGEHGIEHPDTDGRPAAPGDGAARRSGRRAAPLLPLVGLTDLRPVVWTVVPGTISTERDRGPAGRCVSGIGHHGDR